MGNPGSHRPDRKNPRGRWLIVGLAITAAPSALLMLHLSGGAPPSPVTQTDIDIFSGRIRTGRYFFGHPFERSERESTLSQLLGPSPPGRPIVWHPVVSGSTWDRISPHYRYHGALSQIRDLESIWQIARFTPEARRACARAVLRHWQQDGDDHGADRYIQSIAELAQNRRGGGEIDVPDLPDP